MAKPSWTSSGSCRSQAIPKGTMKEYAGRVLMLVEHCFPADPRVRNEAFTLAKNGFRVSVIALRGPGETAREIVKDVSVYRIPRITVFKKLPDAGSSRASGLL